MLIWQLFFYITLNIYIYSSALHKYVKTENLVLYVKFMTSTEILSRL